MTQKLLIVLVCALFAAPLAGCSNHCKPACDGRECGSDGCGGFCGACDAPPADLCLDGSTLGRADALGTCLSGMCEYGLNEVFCPNGCQDGACVSTTCADLVCDAPPGPCQQQSGSCVADPTPHCEYADLPDGSSCSDGLFCNGIETCTAGQCASNGPVDCAPPGPCKQVACDEETEGCLLSDQADGTACDDGDACSVDDTCQAGLCVPGPDQCAEQPVAVAVYMSADNDLDPYMFDDWLEMEAALVDRFDWLRVFVLLDREAHSAWSDTRFYEVHNDSSQELDAPNLGLTVAGQEELNLADGMTVVHFLEDVRGLVGQDTQIFLIMADHGDGWWRRAPAGDPPGTARGCCYDDSAGDDFLTNEELHLALAGENVALLGFDACLQGMAEVAYALRTDAPILVASPELEGGWGWDYTSLLDQFGQGGDRSAQTFGTIAVDTYMDVALAESDHVATGAVYDLSKLDALAGAAGDMALAMRSFGWTALLDLCDQLDWYGCEGQQCEDNADLLQLANLLQASDTAAAATYGALLTVLDGVVLYERHSTGHPAAGGMAIYFPCYYEAWTEYADTAWSQATGWYDMLNDY